MLNADIRYCRATTSCVSLWKQSAQSASSFCSFFFVFYTHETWCMKRTYRNRIFLHSSLDNGKRGLILWHCMYTVNYKWITTKISYCGFSFSLSHTFIIFQWCSLGSSVFQVFQHQTSSHRRPSQSWSGPNRSPCLIHSQLNAFSAASVIFLVALLMSSPVIPRTLSTLQSGLTPSPPSPALVLAYQPLVRGPLPLEGLLRSQFPGNSQLPATPLALLFPTSAPCLA